VNRLFKSAVRADGSEKWVDFVDSFWHKDCVSKLSAKSFTAKYQKWCKTHKYKFSEQKAVEIHTAAKSAVAAMPKNDVTKSIVQQAVSALRACSKALAELGKQMLLLASSLPEYPVVMKMFGVGPTLGPQLMAEIGDVRRFHSKKALVAYAGIDSPPNDSGQVVGKHKKMSKVGSSPLRRTLFLVMTSYLQRSPMDQPVFQFMNRKRAEGKPYKVYMMASANKFLRIYYSTVKAYLNNLNQT
jgi:transposase